MIKLWKKYRLGFLGVLITLALGLSVLVIFNQKIKVKDLSNEYYSLNYDSTWKTVEKNNDQIILKHKSGSMITINITELPNQSSYLDLKEIIDEVLYKVENENPNYHMISKKLEKIGKDNLDGYKVLYEQDQQQAMLITYKQNNKLITTIFEADTNYFDILLDSVLNIVDNFQVKEEVFDLKSELSIETSNLNFSSNDEFDNLLNETKEYEIAYNNYYVKYAIPSIFKLSDFNSTANYFSYGQAFDSIHISVNLYNRNIYEYLDKEEKGNLYNKYQFYKENEKYQNYKESLAKLDSDYESYIYKNSYYSEYAGFNEEKDKTENENVELVYALNNNHILIIRLEASSRPITEKLINQIKIKQVLNYASFIKNEKEDNYLIGTLQRYTDYNKKDIDYIKLKIPDKYEEIDKNTNLYLEKNYRLNYNEDLMINDFDVHYELSTLSIDQKIENINSLLKTEEFHGEFKNLTYSGELTSNGKVFKVYDGGYTDIGGIMFTDINRNKYYVNKKVLFYEMSNGNLYIEINGNGKEITNEMIEELTNFTVEIKNI